MQDYGYYLAVGGAQAIQFPLSSDLAHLSLKPSLNAPSPRARAEGLTDAV